MTDLSSLEIDFNVPTKILLKKGFFESFPQLSSLTILSPLFPYPDTSCIEMNHLQPLSQLTEFNNWFDSFHSLESFQKRYGKNYEILDSFKELKVAKLYLYRNYINCEKIQKSYPHVRFIWRFKIPGSKNHYYEGEFSDGLFHGKGIMYYESKNEKYEGEWKNGVREGKSIMKYSQSGTIFEGEYKNDKREGLGVLTYTSRIRFECVFENDQKGDKGTVYYPDGRKYVGDYNGSKIGKGVLFYSNGSKYDGEWKDNKKEGFGTYTDSVGNKYKCPWKNGKKEGEGIILYSNGGHFDGTFRDDKIEGSGVMVYANGDKYEGEWKNNKKEGFGVMIYSNGDKYEGQWKKDKEMRQ